MSIFRIMIMIKVEKNGETKENGSKGKKEQANFSFYSKTK